MRSQRPYIISFRKATKAPPRCQWVLQQDNCLQSESFKTWYYIVADFAKPFVRFPFHLEGITNYILIIMLIQGPQHWIMSNYSVICYVSIRGMLKQAWEMFHWNGNYFLQMGGWKYYCSTEYCCVKAALMVCFKAFDRLDIMSEILSQRTGHSMTMIHLHSKGWRILAHYIQWRIVAKNLRLHSHQKPILS